MATRTIYRGDSYGVRRPLFTYTLYDLVLAPFDLRGCSIQTTYKPEITTIEADGIDSSALIKHEIKISLAGSVTVQNGLYLVGDATAGVIQERLTKSETAALTPNIELVSDLQITDVNGEVITWVFADKLKAVDAVTNRAPS